ncbi:hypothetical protein L195_g043377 [Trifolium pratense]|uniref:Uncharacterized protein n=1 Tax=Trifolium pratense TaxID=57577 RepID=A0A2K3M927_TRIPR|nr:hypothetical protein L195_g043377 [Trifolium pratense]
MNPDVFLAHSGVRRIEFIEEACIDPWEIDGVNRSVIFNRLVSMATGYSVLVVRETLEQPLPLERLYLSLHQMFGNTPLAQRGVNPLNVAAPQQPLVPQNEVPVVVPDEVVEDDNGMNFMSEEEDPKEDPYLRWEKGEFCPNSHL